MRIMALFLRLISTNIMFWELMLRKLGRIQLAKKIRERERENTITTTTTTLNSPINSAK